MKRFVISDTHFSHTNVIKFCNRNFSNTFEMDQFMIQQWNSVVGKEDEIYHLGDLGWGSAKYLYENIISKLNGRIIFIEGNHDKEINKIQSRWKPFQIVKPYHELNIGKEHIVMMHYPIQEWNRKPHGSVHLHGHSHGNCEKVLNRFDVGVDNIGYTPLLIEYILELIKNQNEIIKTKCLI